MHVGGGGGGVQGGRGPGQVDKGMWGCCNGAKKQQPINQHRSTDWSHLLPVATDSIFASGLKATAAMGPGPSLALKTTVKPAVAVSTSLSLPSSDPRATRLLYMLLARHLLLTNTTAVLGKHDTCH